MVLLTLLAAIAVGLVRVRNLFAAVVLFGAYSFLMASVMVVLDAVDVAMTEAAVGAGVSTVLLLCALHLIGTREEAPRRVRPLPIAAVAAAGAMLVHGARDLPAFGAADSPMNTGPGAWYLRNTAADMDIPNVVTAVLAGYRSFDTLGEVAVIFTAGIGVALLLKRERRGRAEGEG